MPTVTEIIDLMKVSQYLATVQIQRGGVYGGGVDKKLPRLLYMVRKTVERRYEQDPSDSTLTKTANYGYALCGRFSLEAQNLLNGGGGGSVSPIVQPSTNFSFEYLIPIVGSQFADATHYNDARIVGHQLQVFWNEVNRYLNTDEFNITATGIEILISGFDATTTHSGEHFKIYIVDPLGTSSSGSDDPEGISYNLIADDTEISNLSAGANYEIKTITVKPNGYTYTWGTNFSFSDTWPEQPGAILDETISIYTFQYIPASGTWVCIGQSINSPIAAS